MSPELAVHGRAFESRRTTVNLVSAADPGYAYVVLDAMRLGTSLVGPNGTLDVTFILGSDTAPTQTATVSLAPEDITVAHDAAAASGDPYLILSWDIPGGLAEGDYTLSVNVSDENDQTFAVNKTQDLHIGSLTLVADWGKAEVGANNGHTGNSSITSGTPAVALAATDGNYLVVDVGDSSVDDDCGEMSIGLVFRNVPSNATSLLLTVTYRMDETAGSCCEDAEGPGIGGALDWWTQPVNHPPTIRNAEGFGVRVSSGVLGNEHMWFESPWTDSSHTERLLLGSGDIDNPSANDVQSGGELGRAGFSGNPTTDTTYTWMTTDVASFREPNGDVYVWWCGGGFGAAHIDQCTLDVTIP